MPRSNDDLPAGGDKGQKSRLRAARACEPCRLRRVKCDGEHPCSACQQSGLPSRCLFRTKARPNRSRSSKFNELEDRLTTESISPVASTSRHALNDDSSPFRMSHVSPLRPITFIEDAVKQWAAFNGLDPTGIVFHDSSRVIKQASFYRNSAVETNLISFYLGTVPTHTDIFDREKARNLFPRFATLPESLMDDETAYVFACLCKAADMRVQERWSGTDIPESDRKQFQDLAIGYYHLACEAVGQASIPSILTLSALQYLTTFAAARGSRTQTMNLLQKMGWQVHQLGLCKKATANLYDLSDGAGQLLASVLYMDSQCGILLDLSSQILTSELDWDPSIDTPPPISATSLKVMRLEADFLDLSTKIDFQNDVHLVLRTESNWSSFLKSVHIQHTTEKEGMRHSFLGWALIRVSMLSIMLRSPLLYHETLGSSSLSIVARSASTVLRVYWDLTLIGKLEPCWPQLRRITTCIQLVILTCAEGHLHPTEARDLLSIGIDLVRKHEPVSDTAVQMAASFQNAKNKLLHGLSVSQLSPSDPLGDLSSVGTGHEAGSGNPNAEMDWPSFFAGLTDMDTNPFTEESPFDLLDKGMA